MPGLADVREIRRHGVAIPPECDEFKPGIGRFEGRHERRHIPTNAGRGRCKCTTVYTDPKCDGVTQT
jgi:hypothetical protein